MLCTYYRYPKKEHPPGWLIFLTLQLSCFVTFMAFRNEYWHVLGAGICWPLLRNIIFLMTIIMMVMVLLVIMMLVLAMVMTWMMMTMLTSHGPAFSAPTEDLQVTIHSLDLAAPCRTMAQKCILCTAIAKFHCMIKLRYSA